MWLISILVALQVKCTECGHESNTHDIFLDLSLEINHANCLIKALQRFTSSEYLDGNNKYICPKQKKKVRAAKCMSIDKAPAVLMVQLKRFEFSMFGHKIGKKVCVHHWSCIISCLYVQDWVPAPHLTLFGVIAIAYVQGQADRQLYASTRRPLVCHQSPQTVLWQRIHTSSPAVWHVSCNIKQCR